ncbi:MAG TPA: hypothetical protein VJ966_02765 [Actinomycetes bacterium]|nr:hypothetical protein [Actinomycetes bacterium]
MPVVLTLLAHSGGVDETAVIWVPLVLIAGLWWIMRGGDPKEGDDPPPGETR